MSEERSKNQEQLAFPFAWGSEGLFRHPPERLIRQRSVIYAEKYLGRLLGKIPD